jgi:methionyl-tRNA synthetase
MALPESEVRSHLQTWFDDELKVGQTFYRDKLSDFHPSNALRAPLVMALACNALVETSAPWNLSKDKQQENYWTRFSILSPNLFASFQF